MSPELNDAIQARVSAEMSDLLSNVDPRSPRKRSYAIGQLDAILRYAECNPTIPDRALCQCWGDVIKAAIPAALWEKVSR